MVHRIIFIILPFIFLLGQPLTDKPLETCNKQQSLARWLTTKSSMTEEQQKIDVTYYGINIEIDISNQEITMVQWEWTSLIRSNWT